MEDMIRHVSPSSSSGMNTLPHLLILRPVKQDSPGDGAEQVAEPRQHECPDLFWPVGMVSSMRLQQVENPICSSSEIISSLPGLALEA